jgi:hypothetical protein
MNPKENALAKAMQKRGWRVYRNGWPDFLVLDGKFSSPRGCGVEFKARGDTLSQDQKEMHQALALLGIPTHIVREDWKNTLPDVRRGFFTPADLESLREKHKWVTRQHEAIKAQLDELTTEMDMASVIFGDHAPQQDIAFDKLAARRKSQWEVPDLLPFPHTDTPRT